MNELRDLGQYLVDWGLATATYLHSNPEHLEIDLENGAKVQFTVEGPGVFRMITPLGWRNGMTPDDIQDELDRWG